MNLSTLLLVFLLFQRFLCSIGQVSSLGLPTLDLAPARRSLLSHSENGPDTALVAELDGTINLRDVDSWKTIWSFSLGSPIYSSYQSPIRRDDENENASAPGGNFFVDCGDDWKLIAHTDLGKVSLDMTAEEFLGITPHVTEDGGVVLGYRKTSAFKVDAKTGRLIRSYYISVDPPSSNENPIARREKNGLAVPEKTDELQLYITRTDYVLESKDANSGKVLWNLTVSDIGAAFLCPENQNPNSGPLPSDRNDLPSEAGLNFNMPFPCQSKSKVYRLRHNLEYVTRLSLQSEDNGKDLTLRVPSLTETLQPEVEFPLAARNSGIYGPQHAKKLDNIRVSIHATVNVILVLVIVIGLMINRCKKLKQYDALNAKTRSSKRKKFPRSEQNSGHEDDAEIYSDKELMLNFSDLIEREVGGRSIGKLFVSNKEIAKGSNGTIVLEGIYEGRVVAVKRLVKAYHDVAFKEIQNLIASDQHPNIVRWYGVEYDQDFVYLSLERCTCSLYDLIQMYSESFQKLACTDGLAVKATAEYKGHLYPLKGVMQDINLWKANGYPSPILLKLMRNVVSGLAHLHELGIIHRDLKPQNVLIVKEKSLCGKLSDMGISRRLVGDMSSLGHHATGSGSSGWQAPEQLLLGRQTRAVDLFSLGCVLFFCITCGNHPFGDHLDRDSNVVKNKVDLFLVDHIPEAVDLLCQLLNPEAELRPKATEVLIHPLFWDSEMRLSFLRDTSDRIELEDRVAASSILKELESKAPVALGGKWDEKMEPMFLANIARYRRYKYTGVRDLLRVMRNKLNHYRELPNDIQELLGSVPEGFDEYFASRFPKLLIEVYKVMYSYCKEEEWFCKYLNCNLL